MFGQQRNVGYGSDKLFVFYFSSFPIVLSIVILVCAQGRSRVKGKRPWIFIALWPYMYSVHCLIGRYAVILFKHIEFKKFYVGTNIMKYCLKIGLYSYDVYSVSAVQKQYSYVLISTVFKMYIHCRSICIRVDFAGTRSI